MISDSKIFIFLSLVLCIFFSNAQIELDRDYGVNGTVNTNFLINRLDEIHDIFVYDNNQVIAVGATSNLKNFYDFGIVKYLNNGQLDPTFANSGVLTIDFNESQNIAYAVEVLADESILVMGSVVVNGLNSTGIVKLNSTGKIDSTFGTNGWWLHTPANNTEVYINKMVLDTGGKIFISGYSLGSSLTKGLVISILPNGHTNLNFGNNGMVEWGSSLGDADFAALGIQSSGNIIVAGSLNNGVDSDVLVVNYTNTGIIDSTFGVNGVFKYDFGVSIQSKSYEKIIALTVLQNDEIRLGGYIDNNQTKSWDFLIIALNNQGVLQNDFSQNGILVWDFNEKQNEIYDLISTANSELFICSYYSPNFNENLKLVAKITSDGQIDNNFGSNGYLLHQAAFNNKLSSSSVLKIKNDLLYASGSAFNGSNYDFSISRWKNLILTSNIKITNDFLVYPNPFNNYLNINGISAIESIELYSANGQLVLKKYFDKVSFIRINFDDINSGYYILKLITSDNIYSYPIVKN